MLETQTKQPGSGPILGACPLEKRRTSPARPRLVPTSKDPFFPTSPHSRAPPDHVDEAPRQTEAQKQDKTPTKSAVAEWVDLAPDRNDYQGVDSWEDSENARQDYARLQTAQIRDL